MLANWNIDVTTKPPDARLPPAQCRSSATPVGRWRPNGDHLLPGPRLVQKRSLDHRRPDGTPDNVQHCIGFRTIIVSGCESHQIEWRRRTYAIDSTRFIKMWRVWIILMLSSSLDPRPFDDNYNYYITACKYCVSVTHSHSAGGRNAPEFYYRAMHFSAKRGIAIACRLSVCLSVCNVGELWSHRLEFFENNFFIS